LLDKLHRRLKTDAHGGKASGAKEVALS
jgi:hypothetical protein